jgi:DNA (cytosine-5)-methyltransferase 3A
MSTKDEQQILTLDHYLQLKSEGFEFEGQSYLFWEYMRLLNECNPKYFLLENVEMGEKWEKVLSKAIGVNGIHINSALVSAQNRKRIYWTNIGMQPGGLFGDLVSIIQKPKDKGILLKDVLENEVNEKYFLSDKLLNHFNNKSSYSNFKFDFKPTDGEKKGACLTASMGKMPITQDYIKIDRQGNVKNNQDKASSLSVGGHGHGNDSDMDLIVHNMMPRSSTSGKGGTGHLTRNDGKRYCLDTGNTNAVEIVGGDFRHDEGFRWRDNGKSSTLCTTGDALLLKNTFIRRLTPLECERLQTVPDNYTNHVSDSQRYKMLGNGWTIDIISHIFKYL